MIHLLRGVRGLALVAGLLVFSVVGCGGGGDDTTDDTTATGDGTSTGAVANTLAQKTYPNELSVTSPTASTSSTSSSVSALQAQESSTEEVEMKPPDEAAKDTKKIIDASSEESCTFKFQQFGGRSADCYGPTATVNKHPNAINAQESGDVQLPSGDLGIMKESSSKKNEACVASKVNSVVSELKSTMAMFVDSTGMLPAFLCQAKFDKVALPEPGKSVDISESAKKVFARVDKDEGAEKGGEEKGTPPGGGGAPQGGGEKKGKKGLSSTVTISRDAADKNGRPVYTIEISGTHAMGSMLARLKNIALDDQGTSYEGLLQLMFSSSWFNAGGGCSSGTSGMTEGQSIVYNRTGDVIKAVVRRAQFCGTAKEATVFGSDGQINLKDKGWGNDGNYTVFNVNLADGTGKLVTAWQAGSGDDATRVLNVESSKGADGTTSGCGYFGFGPPVTATSGLGTITKMICNWAGPGNNHTGLKKAQKQCFTRNSDGVFVSDASKLRITYAPTNSCDKVAGDFSYTLNLPSGNTSVAAGDAVTNNLVDIESMGFTAPEEPAVP
ncbi:MAG: hypothetical protein HYS22_03910 [Deltaproteobacteria bacterium]|nr:hypothetical protein [Deltaproteobacteria bacterium]